MGNERLTMSSLARILSETEGRPQCTRILTYMKTITFSADEDLIERARALAKAQHKTLNDLFREWLAQFTARSGDTQGFDAIMERLKHIDAGQHFTRDESNAR
jgi:predicted transcriptional regulator